MSAIPQSTSAAPLRTDTLSDSVLILLAMMVVQRLVGFCRAILFCRWLDAEQLGQWDMVFGFLMLAGPLSVLALSSSFGRYVEYYRQRRQLRVLLRRTAWACLGLALLTVALIHLAPGWISQLIFGTSARASLVGLVSLTLLAVIAFNYFVDLFNALRNVRLIAGLQLVNSLAFAALGIGLLLGWRATTESVVLAYGGACAISVAGGAWWLCRHWRALPEDGPAPPHRELWSKLLSFTAWVWITSLLTNLFDLADRTMIIHFSPGSPDEALMQVGQYHSSRVVPLLMVSVATLLGSMLTPHLSHDWEEGHRDRVAARLNLFMKLVCFTLCLGATAVLLVAPLLFGVAFQGKFAGGLAVLPLTLTYCIWFGMSCIAQNYLWCAEKARLGSVALLAGLGVNVALNLVLLPRLGLHGAVLATTAANLVALLAIAMCNHWLGFRMDRGTWILLGVPGLLWLGPWVMLAVLVGIVLEALSTDRILTPDERRQLFDGFHQYRRRWDILRSTFLARSEDAC
jgi:O-antigen/teichoic acid export membrane protein